MKLYGRERELAALQVAFERVVAGRGPDLVLLAGKLVQEECCRLCHSFSAIRSDLHSIESDRALIKPSNLPNGDARKVQADYDDFLLRL